MPPRSEPRRVRAPARPLARAAAAAFCLVAVAGCATPIVLTAGLTMAQAGTSAFIRGELVSARQADLETAWAATLDALDELRFDLQVVRHPDEPERQGRSAYVAAEDRGGPRIRVKLERASEAVTRIKIRVDVLGDQALSRLVLSRIDARLPPPPSVRPPHDRAIEVDYFESAGERDLEPRDWLDG